VLFDGVAHARQDQAPAIGINNRRQLTRVTAQTDPSFEAMASLLLHNIAFRRLTTY
jgi:hypothetical protein